MKESEDAHAFQLLTRQDGNNTLIAHIRMVQRLIIMLEKFMARHDYCKN